MAKCTILHEVEMPDETVAQYLILLQQSLKWVDIPKILIEKFQIFESEDIVHGKKFNIKSTVSIAEVQ